MRCVIEMRFGFFFQDSRIRVNDTSKNGKFNLGSVMTCQFEIFIELNMFNGLS